MKVSSAGHLAVALLSLTPAVTALQWPRWLPEIDTLVVRQEETPKEDGPSPTPTPKPSPTESPKEDENKDDDQKTTTSGPLKPIFTDLNTGGLDRTESGTGTAKATGNRTTTRPASRTQYDPQDPVGGVVMLTPAPTDPNYPLFKIGEFVTWGWNYTNVQATPTAIDIYLKCSKVPQPWTLTANMSFAEPGSYTWDTKKFQTENVDNPLLTEQYTLVIADADGGISATPEPGYLAPANALTFGMYHPQEYHDTHDGWQCASCSGAMSNVDRRAFGVAAAMSAATVLSFTWFVAGFGAL
ncbi:hypothetical protein VTJ83DRAFT_1266 [Remersonia thermophila]|uniref:DUF7137 domain-containing protein n=1 Tax=Remersonia thermophila TaxID=72144 RepID=A0ABR4DNI7_9PEZI